VVVWTLVLVVGWAIRPIDDTVPVIVDPDSELAVVLDENPALTPQDAPRAQLVVCNSPLESSARDRSDPLPTLPEDFVYARVPCVGPHAGAQLALVVNVIAIIAFVVGWIWLSRLFRIDVATDSEPREPSPV
jgi:hypothetical protein